MEIPPQRPDDAWRDLGEVPTASELLAFFQFSPEMLCIAGGDGYFKRVNPAFEKTLGYSMHDLISKPFVEFVHPEDRERTLEALQQLGEGVPVIHFENRYLCRDGSIRWLSWMAMPQLDGRVIYAVASDVSSRRIVEAELRASEQRYRQLLEAITSYNYSVTFHDGAPQSTVHSMGCLATTGYAPEDFAADPYLWIRMVHPDDRDLVRRHAAQSHSGDARRPIEHRIIRSDGSILWVRHTIVSHYDPEGRLARNDGLIEDITERKASEERLRLLVETAPDAMVVVDQKGQIVLVNEQAEAMFGYGRHELLGQSVELLVPAPVRRRHAAERESYAARPHSRMMGMHPSLTALRKDGSEFRAEISLSPIETGSDTLVYAAVRDITERIRMEKSLQENLSQLLAAQRIQQHLLPNHPPVLPGFDIAGGLYPAEYAAGDHFDFLTMPGGYLGIAVADVAGHGVAPAILMASVHAHLGSLAAIYADVEDVLFRLNRVVMSETDEELFLTLLLARLDPRTRTLTYSSAGHPAAYVLDRCGDVRATLPSTSVPIAVLPDAEFPAGEPVVLQPGDIALLFTDGLLETASPHGDHFGYERFIRVVMQHHDVPAQRIVDALHEAVLEFSGTKHLSDDVTVVVIKVDPEGGSVP